MCIPPHILSKRTWERARERESERERKRERERERESERANVPEREGRERGRRSQYKDSENWKRLTAEEAERHARGECV